MNRWTSALSTPTSPPFDAPREVGLSGSVIAQADLPPADRARLYQLFTTYFEGTMLENFERDLAEKEAVIVLRSKHTGEIQGFSTYMRISLHIEGQDIVAFFSGDTIVAREHWGDSLLSRIWSRAVFAEADRILSRAPGTRVYWFLICSGYKTYRFLPTFFREFYPNPFVPAPHTVQQILDALGNAKFGRRYDPTRGVIRLQNATPLKAGVAEITPERLRDRCIAYFVAKNPGHAAGDELACITELSRSNLTRAGERMMGEAHPRT